MPDEWYINFGRIATVGGIAISIFTALIASTYDNLMNYLQALFSIFNAPLFATFIIGMFWKRMTPAAGFWGLIAGTITAAALFIGYKAGWIDFGSDLDQSMWGAGSAFVVDAIVTVIVTLLHQAQADRGAARVWSTAWPTDDEHAARTTRGGSHRSCSGSACSPAPPS